MSEGQVKPQLYVGVAGVTTNGEVGHLTRYYLDLPYAEIDHMRPRLLKLGALMHEAAFTGVDASANGRYVASIDALRALLNDEHYQNVCLIVHLCQLSRDGLRNALARLTPLLNRGLSGIQVRCGVWPPPDYLVEYLEAFNSAARPYRRRGSPAWMVLQLSSAVLVREPAEVIQMITGVGVAARPTHVLIDASGGRGREFEPDIYMGWLRKLACELPSSIGLGVAGGLSSRTLYQLRMLLETNVPFSVDAESQLRGLSGGLDLERVESYLRGMNAVLETPPNRRR